ncbi:MAG: PTS sugar transporter subunit IIA [Bacteroidetes bacterium]|nr:PTS sugar transporter subunit IIA [Bacteroidota bacterium]
MKIRDLLTTDKIISELKGKTKEDVINELVDLYKGDDRVIDLEKIRTSVIEREKIMSTGVGKGFAIPHAKTLATREILVAFGRLLKPIEFEALDEQPVNLVFLIIGKENMVGPHIKLLSRISRMMSKDAFREALANAKDSEEIYEIFAEEEKNYLDNN